MKAPRGAPRGVSLMPPLVLSLLLLLLGHADAKASPESDDLTATKSSEKELMEATLTVLDEIQCSIQKLINETEAAQATLKTEHDEYSLDWVILTEKKDEKLKVEVEEKEEEEAAEETLCPPTEAPDSTCAQLEDVLTNITTLTTDIVDSGVTEEDLAALRSLSVDLDSLVNEAIDEDLLKSLNQEVLRTTQKELSEAKKEVKNSLDAINKSEEDTNVLIIVVSVVGGVMAVAVSSGIVYGFVKNRKLKDDEIQILEEEIPVSTFVQQDYTLRPGNTEDVPSRERGATGHEYARVDSSRDDDVLRGYTINR